MAIQYQSIPANATATLDIFPDEIIIAILSQNVLDLRSFIRLMSVSTRMRRLGVHVLEYSRLPATQLALTIDQEGKSKVTTQFEFSHFCPISFNVLYTVNQPTARRYYTDKAYPVVRSMSIENGYTIQSSSSSESILSSSETLVGSASSSVAKQPSDTTSHDVSSAQQQAYHHGNAKKLSTHREGFHILQVSPGVANHKALWKLAYRITDKHKPEYYLTPLSISIGFGHLLKLDALNYIKNITSSSSSSSSNSSSSNESTSQIKTMNKMKNWVARRLF